MIRFIRNRYYKWKMSRMGLLNQNRKVNRPGAELKKNLDGNPLIGSLMLLIVMGVSVWSMMERMDVVDVPRLVKDQTAGATIYAAVPFTYEDRAATARLQRNILKKLPLYFRITLQNVNALKERLGKLREERRKTAGNSFNEKLYNAFAEQVLSAVYKGLISPEDRSRFFQESYRVIDPLERIPAESFRVMDAWVPEEAARDIALELSRKYCPRAEWSSREESLRKAALEMFLPSVMKYDDPYTQGVRRKALKEAGTVQHEIPKGEMLLRKDSIVSESDLKLLAAYSEKLKQLRTDSAGRVEWNRLLQCVCVAFLLVLFTGIYISHIHPEVARSSGKIFALGLIVLAALVLNIYFVKLFAYAGELFSIPPKLWYLALPVGFAPIVIGPVIGVRTALFSGLFVSLVAAFSGVMQFDTVVFGMVVSAVSSYLVRRCRNYRSLLLTGFFSVSISSLILAAVFCWRDGSLESVLPWPFVLPVVTGVATIVLAQFALILLETGFDLTTRMSLNLYSDYNHPLLKEMQINAPGTYHHSLIVSMLAEAAAEAIGADPVKARVCSLFHDVGKLSHPEYFTENSNGEDKHRDLSPKFSAMIILNHVREGMELARKYKLKRPIREGIQQHHGTDIVYYFYKRAKDRGESVSEEDFRYPGPKPQSRETAILSLADACEAASRSLEKPTHARISELVRTIILKRLRDGQLDDSSMTFRELAVVRESFIKTLTSMLHARVAYPKDKDSADENDLFMDAARKAASAQNA